jgi:hypothetical protein
MTALEDLTALVASLPNSALLTDSMKQTALNGALIPDSFNVWPGQPGYEATHDPYFAAIGLIGFLQAQPVVRQSSSEGTSVAVDAPNWSGLVAYYRSMSPIAQTTGNDVLRIIPIPGGSHVRRTDMGNTGGGYVDVDTDA